MMRIVLDTNVLISGMINPSGPPGRILDLVRENVLELALNVAAPLVTGNTVHFPPNCRHGATVFTPAEFLNTIA